MLNFIRVTYVLILMCLPFGHGLTAAEKLSFQDSLEGCQQGDFDKTKRLFDLSRDTVNYYLWHVNEKCATLIYEIQTSDTTIDNFDLSPIVYRFPIKFYEWHIKQIVYKGQYQLFSDPIEMDNYLRRLLLLLQPKAGTPEYEHLINIVASHSNVEKKSDGVPIYPNDFAIDPELYKAFQAIKDQQSTDFCKTNACPQKLASNSVYTSELDYYLSLKYFYLTDRDYFKEALNKHVHGAFDEVIILRRLGIFDRRCSFELQYYLLREHNNYDLSNCDDHIEKIYDGYLDRNYDGYFVLRNYSTYKDSKLFEYISKFDKNLDETIEYFNIR
ncbi:hypothetical protein [Pseudovibrio sp. SPO723]|uniref:hypothetical protein n=1 Tax=Nesiotobacter zosterae TaxID=392721 RepID=UPI0029C3FA40|nr:hypothetical protein [Pseudovibrio sp. SPO723]MDX5595508.1 hypothetical protein [Pseudovibrio sp. SPO723]